MLRNYSLHITVMVQCGHIRVLLVRLAISVVTSVVRKAPYVPSGPDYVVLQRNGVSVCLDKS